MLIGQSFKCKMCTRQFSICAALCATGLVLVGCGSSSIASTTGSGAGSAAVTLIAGSDANDQITLFDLGFESINLISKSGISINLLPQKEHVEFIHLNGLREPIAKATVPSDTYTSASIVLGPADFACFGGGDAGRMSSHVYLYGNTPATSVQVTLPNPIVVSGGPMTLSLVLQVAHSATWNSPNCFANSQPSYSITPTFTLQSVGSLASGASSLAGLRGFISTTSASNLVITAADGSTQAVASDGSNQTFQPPTWTVGINAQTTFQGVSGPSALADGMPVDFDAAIQPDGSMIATRLAILDTKAASLSATEGPVAVVLSSSPVFGSVSREGSGILYGNNYPGDLVAENFNNAQFGVSGQVSNLNKLPFSARFDGSSLAAGQTIWLTSHATANQPAPTYIPATAVTLLPQSIDGTVTAVGAEGGFQVYTVSLAAYSMFPQLANQALQTTVLSSPQTITVYADDLVQSSANAPIISGAVLRFRGVVFNDNGALRMDCLQISDGIPL